MSPSEDVTNTPLEENRVYVDLLREFYLARLGNTESSSPLNTCQCKDTEGPTKGAADKDSRDHTDSMDAKGSLGTENGINRGDSTNERDILSGVTELNAQLQRYYDLINQDCSNVAQLGSHDDLSQIYLGPSASWRRPSELLSCSDRQRAIELLDQRDALCRKIIAVQHCYILATIGHGGLNEPGFGQSGSLMTHLTEAGSTPDNRNTESVASPSG
ncbi:hypothetical protein BBOV_I003220 [Babesia bovis T2Bo]|uniref:Uncharacterized protein n=1 Tax=Babesia bovis TaxID=5865 RepID=A7AWH6_BABBO|nr:hypothetical protein BBOV_I003220 [Babesia bovis T2Bo]EDO05404.1 hypothetical protein BBOV_I003220 [Babesia bovis T2Bo]|eukprot:XP_001608972.1 hypothetical protein [Babesia bovis T2Bo]